jgi:hypothetical protein
MNTYRITNITDKLGKRENNFNSELKLSYIDEMQKKNLFLKPQETIYFTSDSLPLSMHKMRIKNLISIEEVTDKELEDIQNNKQPKSVKNTNTTTTTKKPKSTAKKKKSTTKKGTTKKSTTTNTTKKYTTNSISDDYEELEKSSEDDK